MMKKLGLVLDAICIKDEIEGSPNEAFEVIKTLNNEGKAFEAFSTTSCLLRAIYMVEKEVSITRLQSIIEQITFMPELVDFKKEDEVCADLINLTMSINRGENDKNIREYERSGQRD